jgi:S1-C subfamily serine protease
MNLLTQLSDEIRNAVDHVLPTIVEIQAWRTRSTLSPMRLMGNDRYLSSAGAGVVIKPEGVVLTNYHVVEGAKRLCVNLQDGRSFEPEVVGLDPVSDIAVLRLPASDLPIPTLSVERQARLGEIVVAVGHPLGLTATVTLGIVSANARFISPGGTLPSVYIQTDAAINKGNSGGALVGCDGMVLGIITWGLPASEAENLAFAIPIKTALKVADRLLEKGSISYGTIGVDAVEADLPAQVVSHHKIEHPTGLLIVGLNSKGSAKRAGIQESDWILTIDGHPIDSLETFLDVLGTYSIGKTVAVRILRAADLSLAEKQVQIDKLEIAS